MTITNMNAIVFFIFEPPNYNLFFNCLRLYRGTLDLTIVYVFFSNLKT
jgi:hypothetical protein